MEVKALEIIWRQGGSSSVDVVARQMDLTNEYARMLCLSLARADYIDMAGKRCALTGKGQLEVAKKKVSESTRAQHTGVLELEPPQMKGRVFEY